MATTYKFEAKDASGRTVSGTLTASTQADVVADLRRKSLVPVSILESRKSHCSRRLNKA